MTIYSAVVITCVMIAVLLNCLISEDINVVRFYLFPLVLTLVVGFLVRMPLTGKVLIRRLIIAALGIALILTLGIHPYFLQMRYAASQDELASVASRVADGQEFKYPVRAGSYTILDWGIKDDGSIYLWTDLDPSGPEGFVFGYKGSGYNVWSVVRLSEDCHYLCED